jgi:hypothetical protein
MVTTIKITCDGVFIQSNSFLTDTINHNNHHSNNTILSKTNQLRNHLNLSDFNSDQTLSNGKYNINDVSRPEKFTVSILNRRKSTSETQVCRNNKFLSEFNKSNNKLTFQDLNNNVNKNYLSNNQYIINENGNQSSTVSSLSASSTLSSSTSSITATISSIGQ